MNRVKKAIFAIFLMLYFVISNKFLTNFPFVHSDEAWLSGLSRNIYENSSFKVTEAFFNIKPRYPHGIKILFHLLQMGFMNIFGYNIYSFRLISLIFACLALIIFYKIGKLFFKGFIPFLFTVILCIDVQFIYASHFARQEIIIVFILLLSLFVYFKYKTSTIKNILLGSIIGISIGFHPNSFIICLPFILMYIADLIYYKKARFKDLFTYLITLSAFACFFILFSFSLDSNFITHYMAYGSEFTVFDSVGSKIFQIIPFYKKLYYGVSGTYYTPNIKFQLIIFLISFIGCFFMLISKNEKPRNIMLIFLSITGINLGIILIGRFNQTSIVFTFPLSYLLIGLLIKELKNWRYLVVCILIVSNLFISYINIKPYLNYSYENYLDEISSYVPKDSKVLANLNCDYYFHNNCLLDYRNLYFLKNNNLTFSQYIRKNKIEYIIYPEEMDLIYNKRPYYNGIYGNLYYYNDMINFLNRNCKLVGEFTNSEYGNRIAAYVGKKQWKVKIYRVNF